VASGNWRYALWGGLLLISASGTAHPGGTTEPGLRAQLEVLNRELARAASFSPGPAQFADLLRTRAQLLVELMDVDPFQAGELSLPPEVVARARRIGAGLAVEQSGEWTGTLETAVADDLAHGRSRSEWFLWAGGQRLQLHFGYTPHERAGATVKVNGLTVAGHVAVSGLASSAERPAVQCVQQCTTTGPQNIAVLMLTSPSYPSLPAGYSAASLQEAFFGSPSDARNTDSLNGYWKEMSYGQTSATGQVFGPFALGQDYTCDQTSQIETAAIAAADATVDFSQFTRIALFFPVGACSSYSGLGSVGCWTVTSPSKGLLPASVGWFPAVPGGSSNAALISHELGHALGLNHSSSDVYDGAALGPIGSPGALAEYGDPFSVMGFCSTSVPGQYTAEHKSLLLKWLLPGDYVEVTGAGTYQLKPYEATANPRALRVLRDAASGAWLWLEYRQPLGDIDSLLVGWGGNLFSGALIHYEDPTLDPEHSYLLDFTPGSGNVLDAALAAGSSWSDPYSLVTLSVGSANGDGLVVNVNYDRPCASLQFASTVFSALANNGSVAITAPPSCVWTASTGAGWIHLSGATSGQGNGTVAFAVDPNSTAVQRNSYLTVARQSTPVVQTGGVLSILSVSPGFGAGAAGQFTFQLSDQNGYGDIAGLLVDFTNSPDCMVEATKAAGIALMGDTGVWLGPIPMGVPGQTLSNSICSVSSGSSFTGSGGQLQATLQMKFSAAFAGSHRITAEAWASAGVDTGTVPLGTWSVPALSVAASGFSPCDVNQDGSMNVGDVQFVINPALGVSASLSALDLNQDGVVNVVDVQTVINAVLGPGCLAK
jgi:M6 family metalloprotease-like protein